MSERLVDDVDFDAGDVDEDDDVEDDIPSVKGTKGLWLSYYYTTIFTGTINNFNVIQQPQKSQQYVDSHHQLYGYCKTKNVCAWFNLQISRVVQKRKIK